MFNLTLTNVVAIILGLVVIALAALFGLISLEFGHLIGYLLVIAVTAYIAVVTSRRSSTLNQYVDEVEARLKRAEKALRDRGIDLPR